MAFGSVETWVAAQGLAVALAVGFVVGMERGWRERDLAEGGRVAGLRTFSLIGLLGGVIGTFDASVGAWALFGVILGLSLLLSVSYREASHKTGNLSVTTAIATVLTLLLGVLASRGAAALALSAAVVVAVLLNLKPTLHRWLQHLESRELSAALQLLVLSVVVLPILPDRGYGPYQALNPYRLWWAVVLIAGLSLAGHFAMRLTGVRRGVFLTGLLGGLASSTAATLALARHAQREPNLADAAAAGALAACGIMFMRMAVLVASVQPALLQPLAAPFIAAGTTLIAVGGWQWRRRRPGREPSETVQPAATFDLGTALAFGAFLAAMAVLVPAARQWLGDAGIYGLAALSGLADVDAALISLMRAEVSGALTSVTTVVAVGLATLVNMVTKACIAWSLGGSTVGRVVTAGYAAALAVGALAAALAAR